MAITSTVAPTNAASSPNLKKSRHFRKNSLFRSFSGETSTSLPSPPQQSYSRTKAHHKATLTQPYIEKRLWDEPNSGSLSEAIEAELSLKKTPSLGELSSKLPAVSLGSLDIIELSNPQSTSISAKDSFSSDVLSSQWELETASELDRIRSPASSSHEIFAFPSSKLVLRPPSPEPDVSSASAKSTFDPRHANNASISSSISTATSNSSACSIVRSKHASTASTMSTLRHFSIISVDYAPPTMSAECLLSAEDLTQTSVDSSVSNNLRRSTVTENLTSILHDDIYQLDIHPSPQPADPQLPVPKISVSQPSVPQAKPRQHYTHNDHTNFSDSPTSFPPYSFDSRNITPSSIVSSEVSINSPVSAMSAMSFQTVPSFYGSGPSPSQVSFKDDTHLGQSGFSSNMLSYKKDKMKYRKKVSKASISLPTGIVECEDHFSPTPDATQDPKPYKRGHRSRNSVIASISQSSLFKPFKRDPSPTRLTPALNEPRTPQPSSSSNNLAVRANPIPLQTANKKLSFTDMRKSIMSKSSSTNLIFRGSSNNISSRKSFLGMSSFSFPSDNSEGQKPIISLPTPIETSREKLKNKLRASTSLLSLTRPDAAGSLAIAVPVEQHNIWQMEKLLGMCKIPSVMDFQSYIDRASSIGNFAKLNEALFSEVFIQETNKPGISKIYKIIPFGNEELKQALIQDILQELSISKLVKQLDGFVDILEVAVVKGRYPPYLLSLWDKYKGESGSKNARPDLLDDSQMYCVIVQSNAGTDLERYELDSWTDAESVFWQTVAALAQAEERLQFEHRDLHWGNIVIADKADTEVRPEDLLHRLTLAEAGNSPTGSSPTSLNYDNSMVEEMRNLLLARSTLKITLIDYALSRVNGHNGCVIHTRMDHPEFYRGKGDYQFDIYQYMRSHVIAHNNSASMSRSVSVSSAASCSEDFNSSVYMTTSGGVGTLPPTPTTASSATFRDFDRGTGNVEWSTFCPRTNVLWLHYLVYKLMNHKGLRPVSTSRSGRISSRGGNHSSSSLRESYLSGDSTTTLGVSHNGGGWDRKSTFQGDLIADEARAFKCLEIISRATDPRRKRMGGNSKKPYSGSNTSSNSSSSSSSLVFQDFYSANDVLRWGIKAKVFPAYASMRGSTN